MLKKKLVCIFIMIALIAMLIPAVPAGAQIRTVQARTADELLEAIDSNTRIELIATTYTYDWALVIYGVENLTIVGTTGSRIVVNSGAEVILSISDSINITISNLFLGHDEATQGGCEAGVVNVWDSENVTLENCDIYGCGSEGFYITESSVVFRNSTIRDCTERIGGVFNSVVEFINCTFRNNGYLNDSSGDSPWGYETAALALIDHENWGAYTTLVTFNNCTFTNNNNTYFKYENDDPVGIGGYSTGLTRVINSTFNGNTWETAPIRVFVDGERLSFDVPPQVQDGRTLVPLRNIFLALGADVQWNGSTQTITATRDDTVVNLVIGSTSPTVNGQVVSIDVPAVIIDGRTLVPLRFVAEAFDVDVDWDGATRTITITS